MDANAKLENLQASQSSEVFDGMPRAVIDLFEPLVGGQQPDTFCHLDPAAQKKIMELGHRRLLRPGEQLFSEGQLVERDYFILSGLIRAFHTSASGREITLAYWRPGSFVGSPDIFRPSGHLWTGQAIETTTVIGFTCKELQKLMEQYPGWAIGLIEALAYKIRCFSALVQVLGTRSIHDRLCQILLALCSQYGKPYQGTSILIDSRFSHDDLSHMVGATRQWVTITLGKLQKRGAIKLGRKSLIILDPGLLLDSQY